MTGRAWRRDACDAIHAALGNLLALATDQTRAVHLPADWAGQLTAHAKDRLILPDLTSVIGYEALAPLLRHGQYSPETISAIGDDLIAYERAHPGFAGLASSVSISSSGSYQAVAYVNRIPRGAASMGLGIYKGNSMVEDHPGGAARTGKVGPLKLTRSVEGRLNARLSFMDSNWKRVHYGNSPAR